MPPDNILDEVLTALPDKALLRVDEVMEFLRCSKSKVYRLYNAEDLRGTRVNGSLLIYRPSIVGLVTRGNGKQAGDEMDEDVEEKLRISRRRQLSKGLKN